MGLVVPRERLDISKILSWATGKRRELLPLVSK